MPVAPPDYHGIFLLAGACGNSGDLYCMDFESFESTKGDSGVAPGSGAAVTDFNSAVYRQGAKTSSPWSDSSEPRVGSSLSKSESFLPGVTLDSNPAWASGLSTPVYEWQNLNGHKPRGVVLMLHAFPMHGKAYDTLARDLAARDFICVAPDMRGFGRTSNQWVSYDSTCDRDMYDLAYTARKQFPGLPIIACGESMGGSFAIRLAAQPGMVDKLIVSGPGLNLEFAKEPGMCNMFFQGTGNVLFGKPMDFSRHIANYYARDPRVIQEILSDGLVRKQFQLDELMQSPRIARSTKAYIGCVNAPVLMLQAQDDLMCAPSGERVMASRLHTRLDVLEVYNNGHVLIEGTHVRPDVKQAIFNWLDREVPPAAIKS